MDATAAQPERAPQSTAEGLLPFSETNGLCWYCQAVHADVRSTQELLEALLDCPADHGAGA